jgi:hypothetical protein
MRPYATSIFGLELLVYEASIFGLELPQAWGGKACVRPLRVPTAGDHCGCHDKLKDKRLMH